MSSTSRAKAQANRRRGVQNANNRNKGKENPSLSISEIQRMVSKKLSPDLQAILNSAGYSIRIEISPSGQLVQIFDPSKNRIIGSLDDLGHFTGARRFVAEERKRESSDETLEEFGAIILFLTEEIKKTNKEYKLPAELSSEFITFLKMTAAEMKAVKENLDNLSEFKVVGSEAELTLLTIQKMGGEMMQAYIAALVEFLKNGKLESGYVPKDMLKRGVPKWFANKLKGAKIVPQADGDINRVLYPQSSKGWVSLTLQEWRSDAVFQNLKDLLRNNSWLLKALRSDSFIREYCRMERSVNLGDESQPVVAKLLQAKVCLIPHCIGYKFAFEPISKNKDQGFWANPRFEEPSEALQSLTQAINRILLGFVSYSDVLSTYWATVFPELHFDRPRISKANNIQKMALDQASDQMELAYSERLLELETHDSRVVMAQLLCDQLHAGPNSPQREAIEKLLTPKETEGSIDHPKLGANFKYPLKVGSLISEARKNVATHIFSPKSEEQKGAIKDILKSFPTGKEKKTANLPLRTPLSTKAQKFISKKLSVLDNPRLSSRMESWFRAFSDEKLQRAAVAYMEAQFDELFIAQLTYTVREDSTDSENDSDDSGD